MGKHKNKADPLTEEDEEALWESGALGGDNPLTLNHTIWYLLSQQFGTRDNQEHTKWTEGLTKTRHGGLVKPEYFQMELIVVPSNSSRSLSQNDHLLFV